VSVDPLNEKYPELSAYQYASNRPISGIDLDGLEFRNANQQEISNYNENGNLNPGDVGYIYRTGEDSYQVWVGEDQWQLNNGTITNESPLFPILDGEKITFASRAYNNIPNDNIITPNIFEMDSGMTILNPDGSVDYLTTNEYGMIRFPENGLGFDRYTNEAGRSQANNENYLINGERHTGDNYAHPDFAVAIYNTIMDFNEIYPNITVHYNDISAYNPAINLGHSAGGDHSRGTGVDFRYIGSNGEQLRGTNGYLLGDIDINNTLLRIGEGYGIINNHTYGFRFTHQGYNNTRNHDHHIHMGFGR
jgi:hypothetical protein